MNDRRNTTRSTGEDRNKAVPRTVARRDRHSAIKSQLQNLRSYKTWIETVRSRWDEKK